MFKGKFGFIPKKVVEFNDGILSIGNYKLSKDSIACIYFRSFNFKKNEWGTIYFSLEGEDYNPSITFCKNVVKFTKRQTEEAIELANIVGVEIIRKENDLGFMPSDKKDNKTNFLSCPNCSSTEIDFMQNNKKNFSVGKAVAGAALTGGVGTLAGFTGKKGKNQWHCKNCGNVFETKLK